MSVDDKEIARPVRLPARSSQGIVLGLDPWQVTSLLIAAAIVLVAVQQLGPWGLLVASPLYLTFAISGVVRRHGMSLPRWWAVNFNYTRRAHPWVHANKEVFMPERERRAGTVRLPGRLGKVQLWESDGIAAVYDMAGKTLSIIAQVEVPGFLMRDLEVRAELAERWSMVLASFTQRPGVKRVTTQERTHPGTIDVARSFFAAHALAGAPASAVERYAEVQDVSEGFAIAHRGYLTLTYDLTLMSAQLKALGGGQAAIERLAAVEAGNVSGALEGTEIEITKWLSVRGVAALARAAFDPAAVSMIESRTGEDEGVDPASMGPMFMEEPRGASGLVWTDSGVHTTLWIHEWPRASAPIGFVNDLVFARHPVTGQAISHIFTVVLAPAPQKEAFKRIQREKKTWLSNEKMRARRGEGGNAIDQKDYDALEQQELDLVAGQGEYRYGAYLTITARDEAELEQAVAGARNALSRSRMEAQVLYGQQGQALLVNALPIGLGLK